jgi:hypothetical protein
MAAVKKLEDFLADPAIGQHFGSAAITVVLARPLGSGRSKSVRPCTYHATRLLSRVDPCPQFCARK